MGAAEKPSLRRSGAGVAHPPQRSLAAGCRARGWEWDVLAPPPRPGPEKAALGRGLGAPPVRLGCAAGRVSVEGVCT